jgi:hypothetical protein
MRTAGLKRKKMKIKEMKGNMKRPKSEKIKLFSIILIFKKKP